MAPTKLLLVPFRSINVTYLLLTKYAKYVYLLGSTKVPWGFTMKHILWITLLFALSFPGLLLAQEKPSRFTFEAYVRVHPWTTPSYQLKIYTVKLKDSVVALLLPPAVNRPSTEEYSFTDSGVTQANLCSVLARNANCKISARKFYLRLRF